MLTEAIPTLSIFLFSTTCYFPVFSWRPTLPKLPTLGDTHQVAPVPGERGEIIQHTRACPVPTAGHLGWLCREGANLPFAVPTAVTVANLRKLCWLLARQTSKWAHNNHNWASQQCGRKPAQCTHSRQSRPLFQVGWKPAPPLVF